MYKILTVIGARPQFIKASVVSLALQKYPKLHEEIIHTGQHFDDEMSKIFFDELGLPKPKHNLNIHGGGHGQMTGRMMEKLEIIMLDEKPDLVVVYGDTNSTLAGALTARKLKIPIAHVESGLRSFNMNMPEEINRILTDRISDLLLCPTDKAIANLKLEGFDRFPTQIIRSGDVMLDSALYFYKAGGKRANMSVDSNYVLCTIHRAENTDNKERLQSIVHALNDICKEIEIILPLHPRTRQILKENNIHFDFKIINPQGYLDMLSLLAKSQLVMTDSGGLQKEAFFFKKPCITLRDETEWTELVDGGYNILAGADYNNILRCYREIKNRKLDFNKTIYGDGKSSEFIAEKISEFLQKNGGGRHRQ